MNINENKKKVLISFIGTGTYVTEEKGEGKFRKVFSFLKKGGSGNSGQTPSVGGKYQFITYGGFPNGKSYSSSLFLNSYIDYTKDIGEHFDKLFMVGTFSSGWAALIPEKEEYKSLIDNLKELQNVLSQTKGQEKESDLEKLQSLLAELAEILEKELSVDEVIPFAHYAEIEDVPDLYNEYHEEIGKKIKNDSDNYEITMDITHSLRWMPQLCHQALSEYDCSIDHLVYGEFEKKGQGCFRDLSKSCEISKMNKALNLFNDKMSIKPLAYELKSVWPQISEVLFKIENMFVNSVLGEAYSLCNELIFTLQHIQDYKDVIVPFESFNSLIKVFMDEWRRDVDEMTTERNRLAICILNIGCMLIKRGLLLQASLANEAALQVLVMGKLYDGTTHEEYEQFNTEYKGFVSKFDPKTVDKLKKIKNLRNTFAHNSDFLDKKIVNDKKNQLQGHNDFLRDLVKVQEKYLEV